MMGLNHFYFIPLLKAANLSKDYFYKTATILL